MARIRKQNKQLGSNIILPYPHVGQRKVREEARRFNVLSAGRRWRKTTLAMAIAVEAAAKGMDIVWGAPTFTQVTVGFEESEKAANDVAKFVQSRMVANFNSGGRITYRSLEDPETSRGLTADGVVIDEAADVREEAYYEVLRPMLLDTEGWAWLIGTPKGLNWFYHEYEKAQTRDDSACWQIPSLGVEIQGTQLIRKPHPYENPNLSFEEMFNLFETMTEQAFRQEILAQFIENAGAVFRNLEATLIYGPDRPENHVGHTIVQGIDWGRINDFTVISTYCVDCNREVDLTRFNKISYPYQAERVLSLNNIWLPSLIIGEENSIGRPILDSLEIYNIPIEPFITTLASKEEIVQALALALEKEDSFWINESQANLEMKSFEVKLTQTNKAQYKAPKRGHDDIVMARCLAWFAARQFRAGTSYVTTTNSFSVDDIASLPIQVYPNSNVEILPNLDIFGFDYDEYLAQQMALLENAAPHMKPAMQLRILNLMQKLERENA